MLSPSRSLRLIALCVTLAIGAMLAGCTASPVYGTGDAQLALARGSMDERNEQLAFRALETRLSFAQAEDMPRLELTVSVSSSAPGLSRVTRPTTTEREMLATITYRVVAADGSILTTGSRTARASYVTSPQALADDNARMGAEARAITAAADALRLVLLAQFGAS